MKELDMAKNEKRPDLHLAIVDDNVEFRAVVQAAAEPFGWKVYEFSSGKDFFAAIDRGLRPDLIVLDMVMPDMDGIETICALAACSLRCPLILVTGRPPLYTRTADELARAHGLTVVTTLQKPVRLAQLRAVLAPEVCASGP